MSIFSNPADALTELQQVRLTMIAGIPALGACTAAPGTAGASYLARKLQASEAEAARRLGVYLEPTELFPVNPPDSDDLAEIGSTPWAVEPAYDMPENFITTNYTGFLTLNQRPIQVIRDLKVIHPATNQLLYDVPLEWIRTDNKHAQVTVMPTGLASSAPVSMFQLQMFYLGEAIPHMIWVRYQAGLATNDPRVPDIQDLILRLAALRVLEDQFLPQSGSISMDGLSRSISRDLTKYRESLEAQFKDLRDSIYGINIGVI